MQNSSSRIIGNVALLLGVIAVVGLIFLTLFYAMGTPFGTLNDICVALSGLLSGALAALLYPLLRANSSQIHRSTLALALAGSLIAPVGSALVIWNVTGWFLAGLITTFGYALIGLWLFGFNYSLLRTNRLPQWLTQYGSFAAVFTIVGLLAGPGIVARADNFETAKWFLRAALFIGGVGWSLLYPIWCFCIGRFFLSQQRLAVKS